MTSFVVRRDGRWSACAAAAERSRVPARTADCRRRPLRSACVPPSAAARSILIVNHYEPLLCA